MYVNDWRILMVILVFTFSFITSLFPRLLPPNSMLFLNFCFDTFCIFRHLYNQPFPSLILPFLRLQERERESSWSQHKFGVRNTQYQTFTDLLPKFCKQLFLVMFTFPKPISSPPLHSLRPRHVLLALHSAKF